MYFFYKVKVKSKKESYEHVIINRFGGKKIKFVQVLSNFELFL